MARKKRARNTPEKEAIVVPKGAPISTPKEVVEKKEIPSLDISYKHDVTGKEVERTITPKVPSIRMSDGTIVQTADLFTVAKGEEVEGFKASHEVALDRIIQLAKMNYNF